MISSGKESTWKRIKSSIGEDPGSVFLCFLGGYLTIVLVCAVCFYASKRVMDGSVPVDSFPTCLYFSVVTCSTLGYGDLKPFGIARLIASVETVLGVCLVGFTFYQMSLAASNRSQRSNDRRILLNCGRTLRYSITGLERALKYDLKRDWENHRSYDLVKLNAAQRELEAAIHDFHQLPIANLEAFPNAVEALTMAQAAASEDYYRFLWEFERYSFLARKRKEDDESGLKDTVTTEPYPWSDSPVVNLRDWPEFEQSLKTASTIQEQLDIESEMFLTTCDEQIDRLSKCRQLLTDEVTEWMYKLPTITPKPSRKQ